MRHPGGPIAPHSESSSAFRGRISVGGGAHVAYQYNENEDLGLARVYIIGVGDTLPANATVECYLSGIFRAA